MKRTTIILPEQLKYQAEQHAKEKGISLAEFIRESLRKNLNSEIKRDSLFADENYFRGHSEHDVAENHDDYLYQ
ncbi:MAG TPA: hypothetical protein ENK21_03760 [Trueperaceae bacterium]|nr:hypothetical protein [Trueperaceae bacterium]